jgi:hypothetical protein
LSPLRVSLEIKQIQTEGQTMSQRTYEVEIEGISPLIQNNPEASNKKRELKPNPSRRSSPEDPQEEWRCRAYYLREDGQLGHPAEAMEMCLREAASEIKGTGKRTLAKPVKRTCFLEGEYMTITNRTIVDCSPKRMAPRNSTGQTTPYYAPEFAAGWRMKFHIHIMDDESVTPVALKRVIDKAGQAIGLGVHRPKYGRFMVVKFDEVPVNLKQVA